MTKSVIDYYEAIKKGEVTEGFLSLLHSIHHELNLDSYKFDRVTHLLEIGLADLTACQMAELFYWALYHTNASQDQVAQVLYPGSIAGVSALPMGSISLINSGWRVVDLVQASMILSERNIDSYERVNSELYYWVELRKKSLPFFMGLMYCGEMVGQVALSLITRDELDAFKAGEITELDFKGDVYRGRGTYYGYISTITVDKSFRSSGHVSSLLNAALEGVRLMHRRGVKLDAVAANAYSPEGDVLCKRAGLTYQREDKVHGRIYTGAMDKVFTSQLAEVLSQRTKS